MPGERWVVGRVVEAHQGGARPGPRGGDEVVLAVQPGEAAVARVGEAKPVARHELERDRERDRRWPRPRGVRRGRSRIRHAPSLSTDAVAPTDDFDWWVIVVPCAALRQPATRPSG